MEKSQSIVELSKALIVFHKEVKPIAKTATNPFFKSKYATLGSIQKAIKEPLAKAKLSYVQLPDEMKLATILMHESGEFVTASMDLLLDKQSPQGQGSALTYARRYALSAILGLDTEEDDDGNEASQTETSGSKQRQAEQTISINVPDLECEKCGAEAIVKSGMKEGKPWAGEFCQDEKCKAVKWTHIK